MFKILTDGEERSSPINDYKQISEHLADIIKSSGSKFSIGIYGEWGTGKTTLMGLIEQQLKSYTRQTKVSISWNNILNKNSNDFKDLKAFLEENYKIDWWKDKDSDMQLEKENDRTVNIYKITSNASTTKSLVYSPKKKVFSALSFLLNGNRSNTMAHKNEESSDHISIRLGDTKDKVILKIGNYAQTLNAESNDDGKIKIHLEEKEILTVWFDAWRYEREEQFALIALMKTIAYAMGDIPYYQDIKKVLLRGLGIIGKDVLRHFAVQYVMTNEGWTELEKKLLPQMDLLSKVDRETIYFDGLEQIKAEMRNITKTYKIVVFIDDLDRCNSKKALEVFESTKAFLDIEGFIFIIGLSIDTLSKLVSKEYQDIGVKGEEYIRKIIQVYINLPEWKNLDITKLIENISEQLEEKDHKFFKYKELIAKAANNNPREVKRLINRFTITNSVYDIDSKIFLIIQAFENRWYSNLYKKLDDNEFRKLIIEYISLSQPTERKDKIKERRKEEEVNPLTDQEKTLFDLDTEFWEFVDNSDYKNDVINAINNWELNKEKYGTTGEAMNLEEAKQRAKQRVRISNMTKGGDGGMMFGKKEKGGDGGMMFGKEEMVE